MQVGVTPVEVEALVLVDAETVMKVVDGGIDTQEHTDEIRDAGYDVDA